MDPNQGNQEGAALTTASAEQMALEASTLPQQVTGAVMDAAAAPEGTAKSTARREWTIAAGRGSGSPPSAMWKHHQMRHMHWRHRQQQKCQVTHGLSCHVPNPR